MRKIIAKLPDIIDWVWIACVVLILVLSVIELIIPEVLR